MTLKTSAALGAILSCALGASALAQTAPAAAPATPQPAPGPVIPGVCTYSNERAIATSSVGKAVAARLQQLGAAVDAELQPEANAIQTEARALETGRASLPADQFQQRAGALQQRAVAFENKRALRGRELQVTQEKQLQRVAQELDPILKQVYGERNCGLMLDRQSLYGANPAMEVTDLVIQRLNAKLTTLTFERERAPEQPAAGQPAAAQRPAAPAATPRPR